MIMSFMVDAIFPHSFARTRIVVRRSLYHKMIPSRKTYIIFLLLFCCDADLRQVIWQQGLRAAVIAMYT
jgi:hypothetical protein